ncbi:MAG: AraC family transcriptional regulator [Clostridia bacterium]|nr:AraC family transcriptional regulator [Clostridia bacterium]
MNDILAEAFWAFDHILISKGYDNPAPHRHLAKHLIFSVNNKFECVVENASFYCKGVCIDSNVEHTIGRNDGNILVFLFDETSVLARELSVNYLMGKPFCVLDEKLSSKVSTVWEETHKDSKKLDEAILSVCQLKRSCRIKYDHRIHQLLESVSQMEGIYQNAISTLCDVVYLSRSRLSHLFKQQVGVSLSSYLVFEKMRKAYTYVATGENITIASVRAGFDSPSHFSAVCKRMFGLSFTDFRKMTLLKEVM